ncbi:MAG: SagB/ThcOx family dehydrogenase [Candidatus Moraniibacteriota bacterium]|nr:MAG: SagB/ThcOx family dehydrogenase [Candidatus Moranbacteria bacterium]
MGSFLYHFFHNETNDRTEKGLVQIPKSEEEWPQEWKTIDYKRYILFHSIALPDVRSNLFSLLSRRRSPVGILRNEVSLDGLAQILKCGYGLQYLGRSGEWTEKRTVPSAGKRYPLELYPILFKDVNGCKAGIYHYGVREHALEPVTFDAISQNELASYARQEWLSEAVGMICISAVFGRMTKKYGSRGYRYVLLEAGHVAQNMILSGTENGINMIPVGGANEVDFERRIGLTNSNERIVYMLFF